MEFPLTVKDFLDRAVTVYPDRVAIVDEPDQPAPSWGTLTYTEVDRLARAQAANIERLGVTVGGRVAIMSQNSARLLVSFFGVSGYGRILVPINFRLASEEVQYIVDHSGAEILMLDPSLKHLANELTGTRVFVIGEDDDEIWASADAPTEWVADESATATINFTSGTTARPKGVELTHRNLWLNATTFGWQAGVNDDDVYLHTLATFHCNGWGMPYAITGMGGKHVILRQVDGREVLERVRQHGVTFMCAAPAVMHMVLDALADWEGPVPGRDIVRVVVAGAPPPTRTIERIRDELGWEFIQIYGMTETSPLLTMSRMRSEWRDSSSMEQAQLLSRAGAPALGVRVRIDDEGEILARSNHVLARYWDDPEGTARVQVDGWMHTGDGGMIEHGYLTIVDRKKDVIVSGGENVSSIEVEDALISHPGVREAAVIGTPDATWGEAVTALVVLADATVTEADLIAHCRTRLAGYKCPKKIELRQALERTSTGKLQKFKLREPYWRGSSRAVN